jgi:hypothetical protein
MKLSRRARLVGVGIGAAAILSTTAALATTAASAAPSHPAVPMCGSAHMRVWTGFPGDGFAGGIVYQLEISNTGHHACTLFGYPGVSELNGSGHEVGLPASHSGGRFLITVPAGGTSHVELTVSDPGAECPGSHAVRGSLLRVFAPNQFHFELTPFSVSVCPHRVSMHVDAVHSNAGIPGYTTS